MLNLSNMEVLLFDCRSDQLMLLEEILTRTGCKVSAVMRESECLAKLMSGPYDLVISDMARRSRSERDREAGLTLIDEIGAAGLELPVIIYGAGSAEKLRNEVVSRGGAGSTSSPFELYELVRRSLTTTE